MLYKHDTERKKEMPPYSEKQNRLFWAAASNPEIAKEHGLSQGKAEELAKEGVKKTKSNPKKLAKALMK